MKKKFTSLLTAMCMIMTLLPQIVLPQTAFAAMGGSGTVSDPYQISTAAELFEFAQKVNDGEKTACAKLTANIDMTGQATWTTICETGLYWNGYPTDGTMDDGYSGVFDGQGFTISNLALASSTTRDASCGLFGTVSGTVKNLKMTNTTFTYGGKDIRVGSIVGQLIKPTGLISDCVVTDANIKPGKHVVGILAGCAYEARIENCMVLNSNYSGAAGRIGAIVADTRGDLGADDRKGTVVNCYSNESPVVGTQSGTIIDCETVPWSMVTSGELAYRLQNGNSNSIWGQNLGTNGHDIPIFNDPQVYQNTCVDVTFYSNTNRSYDAHSYSGDKCSYCGAAKTPPQSGGVYQIGSADQLFAFATIANSNKTANAVLTADIDLKGQTWAPICETGVYNKDSDGSDLGYSGTFDGQGHTIRNLALKGSTEVRSCGLFGTVSGTIKNLSIENVTFSCSTDIRAGAIVGQLLTANGLVTNCCVKNAVIESGSYVVGGIAGCTYGGAIENCLVYGSRFSGANGRFGHIVGDTRGDGGSSDRPGKLENCYTDSSPVYSADNAGTIGKYEGNVTAERFASGEIAYLLNGSKTDGSWGQAVGADSYPRLNGAKVYETTCVGTKCYANRSAAYTYHSYVNGKCIRCGDAPLAGQSSPYKISTADQMCAFSSIVNGGNTTANAELTADITVSTAEGFAPIGYSESNMYAGTFDGQNHTLTVNLSGGENVSPFAWVENATVKNLTVDGTISVTGKFAAGIASEPRTGFTLTNCISKVNIYSTVAGDGTHGGLVGDNNSSTAITNCAFTGSINGANTSSCGGLIGWSNQSTTIKNSYVAASFDVNAQYSYTFSRNPANVTLTNCYYLTALGTGNTGATQLTAEQFASGEAAFKLNGADNGTWKQALGTDEFPSFTGSAVYQNTCADVKYYSNTQGDHAEHEYDANDTCIHCGTVDTFQPVGGVYQIRTAEQLKKFAEMVNNGQVSINGKLVKDIDLSGICGEGKGNWTPIGKSSREYAGTFDGQGYTVSGLYINDTSSNRQGLFGLADLTAEIKNLHVSGSVSGAYYVGGVVGYSYGKVTGCSFSGSVSGSNYVGGVLGCNDSSGTVTDCCNTGTVSGAYYVGGVAGSNNIDCTVSNCYNTGAVSGTSTVGGVAGSNNTNCTVSNCYNTGAVSCTNEVGGIVGYNSATITNNYYLTGTAAGGINGADAEGKAEAKTAAQFASGEVAWLLNESKDNGVWKQTLTGEKDAYPNFTGSAVYKNTCVDVSFYSNTDDDFAVHAFTDGVCTRCGTEEFPLVDGVYQISTAEQLKKFADMVNGGQPDINGKLMNNINLSKICGEGIGSWTPIGTYTKQYIGTFDGQGHTVNGLYINNASADYQGLFGWTGTNAVIKNLMVDGSITAKNSVGGIIGNNQSTVTNCRYTGTVSGQCYVGGLFGNNYGTVTNCYNTGTVSGTGDISGGVAGWNGTDATVSNCYNTGTVSGTSSGSIVGYNDSSATVTNCYYLEGGAGGAGTAKTAEQFASGEVAYLLNGSKTDGAWGQTLTGDEKQSAPVPGGAKVYPSYNQCLLTGYTNDATATVTPGDHTYVDGVCSVCGAVDIPTVDGVYQIGTAVQLKAFAQMVNNGDKDANAVLTADIDLNNESWTTICETDLYWNGYPTDGTMDDGYSGTFDGQGHTISNLALVSSSERDSSCGLFGTVSGTIKNLSIDVATFKDGGKDMRTGAIVGQLITENGLVTDCMVRKAAITPGDHVTGGIAGCVYEGRVENCLVLESTVNGTNNRYGLIVGDTRGDISNTDRCGTVTNCYTDGSTVASGRSGTITDCKGGISTEQLKSGEIAVLLQNGRDTTAWGQVLNTDAYPKPGSANRVYLKYTDCIHKEYSNDADGSDTPRDHTPDASGICTVCGLDSENRFVINSFDKLKEFAARVNNGETTLNAIMTADIEATSDGEFVPIGTDANRYGGTFDGQGYTLTLNISGGESMGAPFAYATGATIRNLTTAGTISASGKYAAGFVSRANNVTLENCLSKVTINSTVDGDGTHGGLIGTVNGTADKPVTITNCGFAGTISGSLTTSCGGLIGWTDQATKSNITNSYVAATFGVKADGSDTFSRNPNYAALTNCYYLTAIGTAHGTQLTAAQFASGEAAWRMNNADNGVWKQNIGTDAFPSFTGSAVYQNKCKNTLFYGNTDVDYTEHVFDGDYCTRCGTLRPLDIDTDGTYHITTAMELAKFANMVNDGNTAISGKLMNDIDLSEICGEGKGSWTPIGSKDNKYTGTLDGQGCTVSGLYISTNADYQGLFGRTDLSSAIKNLHVDGSVIGYKFVGGVVGSADHGTIANCSFSGTVSGNSYVGGILGNAINSNTVTNCYNTGSVSGTGEYIGGVIGKNWGSVSNCCNIGTVSGTSTVGGVLGFNNGTVTNCYYLTGTAKGGIYGSDAEGQAEVKTAAQFASGEVAWLLNGADSGVWKQTIGTDDYPSFTGSTVYQNKCADGTFYSNTDGDFDTHDFDANGICTRCGAADAPTTNADGVYEISTAGQLKAFAGMVNGGQVNIGGKLMNDIDLSSICGEGVGNWTPIGNASQRYNGTFDGQGFSVNGLYIHKSDYYQGLFGYAGTKSVIKNLTVGGSVSVGYCAYIGGVVGVNHGTVKNCCNTAAVSANQYVGGVVGMNYGTVTNCYNIGMVSGDTNVGGVVGYNDTSSGTVTNCYYLTGGAGGDGTAKTAAQFASGEVAWLLNGSTADGVWKQTLSGDTPDAYPNFTGGAVYQNTCVGNTFYSNTDEDYETHDYVKGICTHCGAVEEMTQDESGVYQIENAGQLKAFAELVNAGQTTISGKLMNDIDLSSICGEGIGNWTPIGSKDNKYAGTFDGSGHTIAGLYVNNSSTHYQGLFGYVTSGTIKNLNVMGSVSGRENVGGVVGKVDSGTVTGCAFSGSVKGYKCVGGVVGYNWYGTVTNCYNTGAITGFDETGGVIGDLWACKAANCYNAGKVTVTGSDSTKVGGVIGVDYRDSSVSGCYYLEGTAEGGISSADVTGQAEVKTEAQFASGEVTWLLNGSVDNGVWKQTLSGDTPDAYPNFTGGAVYQNTCGSHLFYDNTGGRHYDAHAFVDGVCTQCGMHDTPMLVDGVYEISTAHQLKVFADMVNDGQGNIKGKLMNDIDLSSICGEGVGNWTPIGNRDKAYSGTFDGQGFTVSGLYINNTSSNYQGLFGVAYAGSVIKNLTVSGSVSGYIYVGGIVGFINEGELSNCRNTAAVSGEGDVGGIVGFINKGELSNCRNTAAVSGGENVGGIAGLNNVSSTMTNCCNTGSVSGGGNVGGVAGENTATMTNCYNIGSVSGNDRVGGVVGYNDTSSGTVTNCYYLTGGAGGDGTAKTAAQFASGEVAWLLNGSTADGVWKQTIGTDDYPNFTGLDVYYNADTEKYYNITGDVTYTNTVKKKITANMTQDNSEATAVLSEIETNGNTIHGITWSYTDGEDTYSVKYDKTEISGESSVLFGIVVPALLTAEENNPTDQISVDIE